jgi:DNA-binding NarL/FixJ family response regulator
MRRLRVLVVEDHPLMVEAIRLAVAASPDFEITRTVAVGRDVCAIAQQTQPDVVLLDLDLLDGDALHVIQQLAADGCPAKVIVFSGYDSSDTIDRALRGGAYAFITKRIDPADLPAALRQALDQTLYQPLHLNPLVSEDGSRPELNERELAVLAALAEGLSNKKIARRLSYAEQTVKFHLSSIYRKLGVSSRTEAVADAYRCGLLEQTPLTVATAPEAPAPLG